MNGILRRNYQRRAIDRLPLGVRLAYRQARDTAARSVNNARRHAHDLWYERRYTGLISLDTVLTGGDSRFSNLHAYTAGEVLAPIHALEDSPHVQLLRQYDRIGNALFQPAAFANTAYYRYAADCERYTGHRFFGQRNLPGFIEQARAFVRLYESMRAGDRRPVHFPARAGHSTRKELPLVQRTWTPGVYQVINGHHRLAVAYQLGFRRVNAIVLPPQPTELQYLVAESAQPKGARELYQPIDAPDFTASWPVLRGCADRFGLMTDFLVREGLAPEGLTVLDLACSYGWFAHAFAERGCAVLAVERNPLALRVGQLAYGLRPDQCEQTDVVEFLERGERSTDITLFLSILHHFVMRADGYSPATLLRLVDRATRKVLFLDMGQEHEEWFRRALPGWNDDRIVAFIRDNTSFTRVAKIGVDRDNHGRFARNYGRSLFACTRE